MSSANALRKMYDDKYFIAADLIDATGKRRNLAVTATRFEKVKLRTNDGGEDAKSIMYATMSNGKPTRAPIVISKRNLKAMGQMYGFDTDLEGKAFELYLLDEKHFGVVQPVIKIRKPGGRDSGNAALSDQMSGSAPSAAREPGSDDT
jgi:hypothetical protein